MAKSIIVTVKASAPCMVISERIGDRERHENGIDVLAEGDEMDFIVHDTQSIRVVREPDPAPVVIEDQAPEATRKDDAA